MPVSHETEAITNPCAGTVIVPLEQRGSAAAPDMFRMTYVPGRTVTANDPSDPVAKVVIGVPEVETTSSDP